MSTYQLEIKQIVDYPRCRMYREFVQTLIADRSIHTRGCSGLFHFVVLCSYANFRTSYRRLDGISYTIYPGEWICRLSELGEWLRLRTRKQILGALNALQDRNFITYTLLGRDKLVKYSITGWRFHNTVLDYNCPCQKDVGFFFLPVSVASELIGTGKCSEMDVVLDLWLSAIYNDERVQGSDVGPVVYEGYHYAWAYTTKTEHPFNMSKTATETVTVETAKNDLTQILDQLAPTIAYDDGEYSGELALDHTTLHTEAAGYETRRSTITETKTIGQLSSNDMSYIPATAVKNGKTLSLASIEWQVSGTALVGEELVPSEFQAIATYTGSSSYQAATGYVTTAEYKGEVTAEGIESITYTVVFTGEKIEPLDLEAAPARMFQDNGMMMWLLLGITAALLIGSSAFLVLKRKNVYVYVPGSKPRDYKLVAKFRLKKEDESIIDLSGVDIDPEGNVAIEIKRSLAKRLKGKVFSVECVGGLYQYTVQNDKPGDWHEFNQKTMKEVTS